MSNEVEWQQFEYFQTLARLQHMTKAAKELSITQPALSRSLARFEEEIGVSLFERQGRSIRLNQYGEILLKSVKNMMSEFEKGKQEIQHLLDPDQGQVSLGFLHTLSTNLIPDLLVEFRRQYPKVNFSLRQSPTHILLDQLEKGELDICLISPMGIKEPVAWKELWREELFAIVPTNHAFATKEAITIEELVEEPFIHLKKGFSLRVTVEQFLHEVGVNPHVTFEGEEADTVAGLVAAGLGVSILPDLKGVDQSHIVKIPIHYPKCERLIGIAWVKGRYISPAVQNFKEFVLKTF